MLTLIGHWVRDFFPQCHILHMLVRVKGNEVGVWTCGMKGGGGQETQPTSCCSFSVDCASSVDLDALVAEQWALPHGLQVQSAEELENQVYRATASLLFFRPRLRCPCLTSP